MLTAYAQLAAGMALSGANVAVAKLLAGALPLALIAADPGGIDQAALCQIADQLRTQLPEEVGR